MYNSKNNQSIFYNMQEMLKLAAVDRDKLIAEMAKMDKNAKMEMENVRLETTDQMKINKDEQDAFIQINSEKMGKFETRMN